MSETNQHEAGYILGHSEAEILRLQTQAKILGPITERLLQRAGIRTGMRVLDVGSGAGDVAMLARDKKYAEKMFGFWIRAKNCGAKTRGHRWCKTCHELRTIALLQRTLFAISTSLECLEVL